MIRKNLMFFFVILTFSMSGCAQDENMKDYIGIWVGIPENKNNLNLDIIINLKGKDATLKISNSKDIFIKEFSFENQINLLLTHDFSFKGMVDNNSSNINGFIKLKRDLFPVKLEKQGNRYIGKWNLSALHYLRADGLKLIMEGVTNEEYNAYPILGSFWCTDFKKKNDSISFNDYRTGLFFDGKLSKSEIIVDINLGFDKTIATVVYKRLDDKVASSTQSSEQKTLVNDGWEISNNPLNLKKMEEDIGNNLLEGTEGIVISKNGKIVYERYFGDFNANTPHDTRSAGKSYGSAIIGLAIDNGVIENVEQKVYKYLPKEYQYTIDSEKSKIILKDLLTMSSGIKVGEDDYQSSDNWLKKVLEVPLKHNPKEHTIYKSADPFLAGVYLSNRLSIPMEFFIHEKLFEPLGIKNYIMNTDDTGIPYFAGGIHLTPRDMLKFGQLYLNKGIWKGKRIMSEEWINDSFKKHTFLEDVADKNKYGYLWWHNKYNINGKEIKSIEARGAGGQYIFVLPQLNSVVAITSGNYRNGKTRQPEKILHDYILSTILN